MRWVFLAAVLAALATSAQAQNELQDVGCAGEGGLRSIEDAKLTEVIFFNQSPTPIRTYWLDHQGSFMEAIAAQPAFRLLRARDLGRSDDYPSEKMPGVNEGLLDGVLAAKH